MLVLGNFPIQRSLALGDKSNGVHRVRKAALIVATVAALGRRIREPRTGGSTWRIWPRSGWWTHRRRSNWRHRIQCLRVWTGVRLLWRWLCSWLLWWGIRTSILRWLFVGLLRRICTGLLRLSVSPGCSASLCLLWRRPPLLWRLAPQGLSPLVSLFRLRTPLRQRGGVF